MSRADIDTLNEHLIALRDSREQKLREFLAIEKDIEATIQKICSLNPWDDKEAQ